jgi:predicted Zn-dependent protease
MKFFGLTVTKKGVGILVLPLSLLGLLSCMPPQQTIITKPPPEKVPPPVEYKPVTGPAATLYAEAQKANTEGRLADAEIVMERAIRIEPRNPFYWHYLAEIKYKKGDYRKAVQVCLKADTLAGPYPQLAARNKELMAKAKRAMQPQ